MPSGRPQRAALGVLALLLLASCTSPDAEPGPAEPQPAPVPAATSSAVPPGLHTLELSGGAESSYLLHAPPGAAHGERLPLVVVLHGVPGSPEQMERTTGLDRLADDRGFLVAYPATFAEPEDVGLLVDDISARWPVDPDRVHVTGFSVGGAVTYTLATTLADRIASFAAVSGPTTGELVVDPPTSLLAIEGERDDLMPTFRRADRAWDRGAGCGRPAESRARVDRGPAVRLASTCRGGTDHVVYRAARMGHEWPVEAARIIWDFFAAHPLR